MLFGVADEADGDGVGDGVCGDDFGGCVGGATEADDAAGVGGCGAEEIGLGVGVAVGVLGRDEDAGQGDAGEGGV